MTDRELLELAAKAAGYIVRCVGDGIDGGAMQFYMEPSQLYWNPLTDGGDALRLAVTLRLAIGTPHAGYRAYAQSQDRQHGVMANCGEHGLDERDQLAATCRAIVRAAAEIGAAMEKAK